ncbi:MAG: hypothetical protein U9R74_01695 [Pseudomonadota bacterium]|nr:hypothetical protein [Pseudomonadota bacterium]
MKQRARLSLSRSRQVDKKPPPGFETESPDSRDNEQGESQEPPQSATSRHSRPNIQPRASGLIDTRKLVRVFIVVGLGVLSLYLLKRRLS